MDIIDTFLEYVDVAEAFADRFLRVKGIIIALIIGTGGIYVTIRNYMSSVSHDIAYRKTELLTKLEDLIQELETYIYSFDAETYSERKQPNESFFTAKSHHLNAWLGKLYKMRTALKKKQFDTIDSVESALREINTHVNCTHGLMIRLSRKTRSEQG